VFQSDYDPNLPRLNWRFGIRTSNLPNFFVEMPDKLAFALGKVNGWWRVLFICLKNVLISSIFVGVRPLGNLNELDFFKGK